MVSPAHTPAADDAHDTRHGVFASQKGQRHVVFLLLETYSMLSCVSALEPLRVANRLQQQALYGWTFVSRDGAPVHASNGMSTSVDASLVDAPRADLVLVCGPFEPRSFHDPEVLAWLRSASRGGAAVAGIETGAYVLALAGLLAGKRCTIHWENREAFTDAFPDVQLSGEIYEVQGRAYTCAGGAAALDLMLHVVSMHHDARLAADVSEALVHDRIRTADSPQRMDVRLRTGIANPVLLAALELMESNLEQPLSSHELAVYTGVSRRQLERLFKRYLGTTPSRHYMLLRLRRGRDLLTQTRLSVMQVALSCGFTSAGHFSHRYRETFGHPPRNDRVVPGVPW